MDHFIQIDSSTVALGGGDIVEIFRISKNTDVELDASLDDAVGHQYMNFNKRKSNIRIVVKRLAGDVAFIQTGRCVRKTK